MSTHPNAMIMAVFTPDNLSRKTYRAMLEEAGADDDDPSVKVGESPLNYSLLIMEDSYDDSYQISAPEGSIVAHAFLTYGYGDVAEWSKVEAAKEALQEWALGMCERHKCAHQIFITANYW